MRTIPRTSIPERGRWRWVDSPPGWGHAEAVVGWVDALARQDATDPVIAHLGRQVREAGAAGPDALVALARRIVRYEPDPEHRDGGRVEFIVAPRRLLAAPDPAGDCDDLAALVAAVAYAAGWRVAYAVSGDRHGDPGHVWALVARPGEAWVAVDPVVAGVAGVEVVARRVERWYS